MSKKLATILLKAPEELTPAEIIILRKSVMLLSDEQIERFAIVLQDE